MWKETSHSLLRLIHFLKPSMLLQLLHSKDSDRKQLRVKKKKDGQKTLQICFDTTKASSDTQRYAVSEGWRMDTLDQVIRFKYRFPLTNNTVWFATNFLRTQSSNGFPGIAVLYTFRK